MNRENILKASNEEILKEIERVRVLYTLKHTIRYLGERDMSIHSESVAEHIYAMQVIAQYFYPLEDLESKLDRVRVNEIMLFHEIGEIETGDIVANRKTEAHRTIEREAARRVALQLPASLQRISIERYREFDENKTPESRYANAIDKLEPIFEMWDEKTALPLFKKNNYTHQQAVSPKTENTTDFPCMRKFIDAWESRALALDIFPA